MAQALVPFDDYRPPDAATFRVVNPQFADLILFPPEAVSYWLARAAARLDPFRWAELLPEGTVLFVAHNLALGRMAAAGGAGGGAGGGGGVVSSKSVGGVSVAYNTEIGSIEGGGAYNLTPYGRQFLALARLVGMGAIQL